MFYRSLAFAIAEHLLFSRAYCLFVTHFVQITSLSDMYPTAHNVHLKTSLGVLTDGLKFLHKLGDGPCEMKSGYGIMMAESCNFPENVSCLLVINLKIDMNK